MTDGDPTVVFTATALRRVVGDGRSTRTVLDGVDLELRRGEVVVLTGPSGAGKTTLLHLVSGFDQPDGGHRRWLAGVPDRPLPWHTVAVVPQGNGLLGELSYAEHLAIAVGGTTPAAAAHPGVAARLAQLGLADLAERLPAETSLGQQQRLAVARALIAEPALIVADEPTSRQDHAHAELVVAALRAAADGGAACLIASHDPLLRDIADRVLVMIDGALSAAAAGPVGAAEE